MNTIISPLQQRAIDYCDRKQMPKIGRQIAVIAYMHGANEQREVDIEKAISILRKTGYFENDEGFSEQAMIDQFKQAMIED